MQNFSKKQGLKHKKIQPSNSIVNDCKTIYYAIFLEIFGGSMSIIFLSNVIALEISFCKG